MKEMKLREICVATGVSRRAIQGYEEAGLVSATGRNERGYLLYDEMALEKIKRIKLFQEMGFSIKEIQELEGSSNEILKEALEQRAEKLIRERGRIDDLIIIIQKMIENL